jgi:hypothetical protein
MQLDAIRREELEARIFGDFQVSSWTKIVNNSVNVHIFAKRSLLNLY